MFVVSKADVNFYAGSVLFLLGAILYSQYDLFYSFYLFIAGGFLIAISESGVKYVYYVLAAFALFIALSLGSVSEILKNTALHGFALTAIGLVVGRLVVIWRGQ